MGWKAENNRHAEDSRVVIHLRPVDLTQLGLVSEDLHDLPYIYLNPEDLSEHRDLLAKAERNCLYFYPRTYAQYVSRVQLHRHVPRGQIAITPIQLRNFELTCDGLETFPWSSFDVIESSTLKHLQNQNQNQNQLVDALNHPDETLNASAESGHENVRERVFIQGLRCVELELCPLFEGVEGVEDMVEVDVDGKAVVKALSTVLLRHIVTLHERFAVEVNALRWLLRVTDLESEEEEQL